MVFQVNMVERIFQCQERLFPFLGFQLTFPYRHAVPPHSCQFLLYLFVTLDVACDFSCPELRVRFGNDVIFATLMTMPETAVDKDAGAVFPQHNVRTSRQTRMVQTVSESVSKQILPDYHFRLGIGRMNGSHVFVPLVFGEDVHDSVVIFCYGW